MSKQTYKKWTLKNPVSDELMVDHWTSLTHYIVWAASRTYHLTAEDREDLESEMVLKLLKCPQAKRCYEGYIKRLLSNAVRSALVLILSHGGAPLTGWREFKTLSYSTAPADMDEASFFDLLDGGTPHPEAGWVDGIVLSDAVETLSVADRQLIQWHYADSQTYEWIAAQLGYSQQTVRNRLAKAIRKLRKELKGIPGVREKKQEC